MKTSLSRAFSPAILCLPLACLALCAPAQAEVSARYVRVENPTAMYMEWQEVEVYSAGTNIVRGHPEWISGAHWYESSRAQYSDAMIDGKIDVNTRGTDYALALGNKIDVWFELDLGKPIPIDEIKLYGGSYPKRQFGDKGNRLITLLDDHRKVLWASSWDYFDSKTAPAIGEGIFSFKPSIAAAVSGGPVVGMTVPAPEQSPEWSPMSWLLKTQKQPLPAGAADRLAAFKARNSTGLPAFAKHFFALIEPDVKGLVEARNLHQQGKDLEAMDAWKHYWFAKISRLELGSVTVGGSLEGLYNGIGDDLSNNIRLDLNGANARMVSFVPGAIDWLDSAMGTDNKYVEKFTSGLLEAYGETGNAKYLAKWAEIMDDWSANYFTQTDTSPTNVKNLFTFCEVDGWMGLLGRLNALARKHPEMLKLIPATTLARMQLACLEQYGPAYWRPTRDMLFGHASSSISLWRSSLDTFDEFSPGRRTAKEWRQHFERWMTMCTAPDGLMVGNEDEPHMIIPFQLGATIAACEKNPPEWYTPGVRNRALAWLDSAHKDIFRHPTPGGYDHRYGCVGLSWDRYVDLVTPYGKKGFDRSKVIYAIPEVRRILAALCGVSEARPAVSPSAPSWQNKLVEVRQKMYDGAVAVLGTEKPGKPVITSDWMPYGGSYYFRSGWDPNDAFFSMLARTTHGAMMANSCGQFVHYDYFFPLLHGNAIKINGLDRLANTKFPRHWTKHCQVDLYAENTPEPFRWHTSPYFAIGEAEFTGRFQNDQDRPGLQNVRQVRQVLQLRGPRLFIVTDATAFLDADEAQHSHDFSLDFAPSLTHLKDGKHTFSEEQLQSNAETKTIKTANPDGPNEAIYQFTSAKMNYNPGKDPINYNSYPARFSGEFGFSEPNISTRWSGSGASAMVTVMSSSDTGAKERITQAEAMNDGLAISGFHASLADGGSVWYQAAADKAAPLHCGEFTAQAKTLLIYSNASGVFLGIALDCSHLADNGTQLHLPTADMEFTVSQGKVVRAEPIYRPIDPVRFSPEVNTFLDSQLVTLASNTDQVEIRYTIDGTQPTTTSLLYTKPFTITASTEIAARAYRLVNGKVIDFNDFEINGTKFTETTYGWFYRKPAQDAVTIADATTLQPGLTTEYIEGNWTTLYADGHWLPTTAFSAVPKEMDLSPAYDANYYYGMRYKGFVKIPTQGVYTFHAPTEFTSMSCSASYDYRLYIDGQEWDLTQWFHGRSTWSVALKPGYHTFQLDFANARIRPWRNSGLWVYGDYPSAWVEHEGAPSPLLVSGPGLDHQPLPSAWFFRRPADVQLSGVIIGSGDEASRALAFDGDPTTVDAAPDVKNAWVGLDLGTPQKVTRIRFATAHGLEASLVHGVFQGATDAAFSSPVDLAGITSTPSEGWTDLSVAASAPLRYVRYLSPDKSGVNIAEVEFYAAPVENIPAPTAFTAKAVSITKARLTWASPSGKHKGYIIERALPGHPFVQLAKLGPDATAYEDEDGLAMASTYHYRIYAQSPQGDSPYSPEARATTPGSTGTGLQGEYFSGLEFNELKKTRIDDMVNFEWTSKSPDPSLALTNYTVRWTGKVQSTTSETYTFSTASDDGARLWVNGKLLIDKWVTQGGNEWSGSIDLKAGELNDIKLEYFQAGGGALVRLSWSSPNHAKEIIPALQLYPPSKGAPAPH